MRRIIGLDYGSRTVGVAVSDPLGITAQPVETIWRKQENHLRSTLRRLEELAASYDAGTIVLGLPLNMDGSQGERALLTKEFKEQVEKRLPDIPVILWDERLTTLQAGQALIEGGVRREMRKQYLDSMAAVLILQNYLDCSKLNNENHGNEDHE
ncbi:MAG: Holliday junction resolvase RuvX [Blautia sp.]|nr:Holliday junction resolvase RuvX [Blautia sp.]